MRIIGIDPGLSVTGWGIVASERGRLGFVASGAIKSCARDSLAVRLATIHTGLSEVFLRHMPREAAVERMFVNKDAVATLKLGYARGIALLVPAQAGIDVMEYAPNTVKKTVVGVGHAQKRQIRAMVRMLLPKAECETEHAADALAVAIAHAHRGSDAARSGGKAHRSPDRSSCPSPRIVRTGGQP